MRADDRVAPYDWVMPMNFTELDATTREWMLKRFEAEEKGGTPYRSNVLTPLGLVDWPDLMRQAITDPSGSEVTLSTALNRQGYWNPRETYVRDGVTRDRKVNYTQAAERLSITEFNTWYVAGLANRLQHEQVQSCRVYRAANPKWEPAGCSKHEGQVYPVADIIAGHRIAYWPQPGVPGQLSIPGAPGCHHTIERI